MRISPTPTCFPPQLHGAYINTHSLTKDQFKLEHPESPSTGTNPYRYAQHTKQLLLLATHHTDSSSCLLVCLHAICFVQLTRFYFDSSNILPLHHKQTTSLHTSLCLIGYYSSVPTHSCISPHTGDIICQLRTYFSSLCRCNLLHIG